MIKHDTRNEIRETKIKYSFFGLICTMNQLTGFNSNRLYVYLIKQSPYCKKIVKHWDFLVVFVFDVVNPYCITSLDRLHGSD